ncbi:MAG: MFS transporter [Bacteroidales bacterium]|jgi:fucose permease
MRNFIKVLPVFVAFYCMGFVDIVGTAVNYASKDFELTESTMQFLTMMIFIWFFVFSIPTGILQDKFSKKTLVISALIITTLAMLVPFLVYNYVVLMVSLALMGIGNTIIQVSLNPLLYDVSPKGSYSSNMSLSQFIKAIAAFLGPVIAVFFVRTLGDWKFIFVVYGCLSIVSGIWLFFTPVRESRKKSTPVSFRSCFKLFGNTYILVMVLGIFIVVGLDVGMNTGIPNVLKQFGLTQDQAIRGISLYFIALMVSRFLGALILKKISSSWFLLVSAVITLAGLILLIMNSSAMLAGAGIVVVALGSANIFPLIFSLSVEKYPEKSNEISALMIMAISGGAIFPFIMGVIVDTVSLRASIVFLFLISLYLFIIGMKNLLSNPE